MYTTRVEMYSRTRKCGGWVTHAHTRYRACNSMHIVKRGIQSTNKSLIGCYMSIHVFYSLLLIRKGKQ